MFSKKILQGKCLLIGLAAGLSFVTSAANANICHETIYGVVKAVAESNGYPWSGTRNECHSVQLGSVMIVRDSENIKTNYRRGNVATISLDPVTIQFANARVGNHTFCATMRNGKMVNIGKTC